MLQVGSVIQDLSVRELVTMMASLYPNPLPVDEAIALARIADLVGRKTTKLSGGQTQRVRFALALVSNPDLLVLDEPTVALDVEAPARLLDDDARVRHRAARRSCSRRTTSRRRTPTPTGSS